MKPNKPEALKKKRTVVAIGGLLVLLLLSGLSYIPLHVLLSPSSKAYATTQNPIQVENSLPGTPGWNDFSADLSPTTLSGFGSQISVNHGDSLSFYVTTTAPNFTIGIYRTGYYQGIGARLIESLGSFPGLQQAIPTPDPVTGLIACTGWKATTSLTIPSNWVTGVYLAKLTSSTGNSSFIFFVVRDDGGSEDVLFQTSVTTYQAYNTWGGLSLYNNDLTNKTPYPYAHATKVSFDRPFNPGDSNGAGHYFFFEYKMVYWLEEQGYNVAYTTDVDTDARPSELLKRKAFLSVGHDEYWSMGMRNAVQNAINHGVNVAFFSANVMYWQIRFEPNSNGVADRVEVGYKDFATFNAPPGPDPQWNVNNSLVTANWRDPVVNMPENGMLGVMFEQQEDADYAYVVENASNWIYAGTGFVDGTAIPGIVGYEYDKVWNNGFTPPNMTVLSNSPVHGCCGGYSSFSNSTLYTAPSGARVFAAGTIQWSLGLANIQGNTYMNAGIQRTTTNILNNFIGLSSASASSVSFSSDSLSLGNQGVHTTGIPQTVKVTNSGTTALTISSIKVTGADVGDFSQTNNCPSSLAAGASCTLSVSFTPIASGTRSGAITLTDNAGTGSQDIVLSGTGIGSGSAVSLSTANLSFGNQTVGTTSAVQTVTLTNSGVATLTFSFLQVQGLNSNDFTQTNNCPTSLAVGASCTITVTFTPSASGTRSGNVTFSDNASDSPETLILSGSGVSTNPGITLSPLNLSFSSQDEGTTSGAQTVTLTNSGSTALTINSISLTGANAGDFVQTNTCSLNPNTLAVNASCVLSVTFTPTDTGSRSAVISIADNLSNSPQTVTLNGVGVEDAPGVNLSPPAVNFGNQINNTTSGVQTVTLTNNGSIPLVISAIALAGTNPADFAQANTCPLTPNSLAVNASCTISVTFTPQASGSFSANVQITDNVDGEGEANQTVVLNGTGVPPSTVYFSDGFESGDFSQWTGGASGNGSATVQSSLTHSGGESAELTDASGQTGQIATTVSGLPTDVFTRFYFNLASVSGTTLIALGQDASGHNKWIVYYDSGRQGLDIYFWNGAGTRYDVYSNANVLSANTWYEVEVETNQAVSGHGEVWLNGNSIGFFNGDFSQTQPYSSLALTNQATGSIYFDDVAIANGYTIPPTQPSVNLNPASLNFGSQIIDTSSGEQAVTVTNPAATALTLNSITLTGTSAGDFTQTNNCPGSLSAKASCTINVIYTPLATGASGASVTLNVGSQHIQTVSLSGTGIAASPIAHLSVTSLTFNGQTIGTTSSARTVTLTNTGVAVLTITGIVLTGTDASDFAQTNTCPSSLAVNASCTISVTFTPSVSGSLSAAISLTDNANDSPQTIALNGTAVNPPPSTVFSDGFEGGNFSQWTGGVSGTGTATVQGSVINSGSKAAELTDASGQTVQIATTVSGLPTDVFTRFYFNLASVSGTTLIALGQDASGHNKWIIYYDSGRQGLDIYLWNGAGTRYDIYSNTNVLSANTWYEVEIEVNQSTSGHGEVWLNGNSIGSFNGDFSQTQPYSSLVLTNQATGSIYFDDVALANGYNGLVAMNSSSITLASQLLAPQTFSDLPVAIRRILNGEQRWNRVLRMD